MDYLVLEALGQVLQGEKLILGSAKIKYKVIIEDDSG